MALRRSVLRSLFAATLLVACGDRERVGTGEAVPPPPAITQPAAAPSAPSAPLVVFLGDSLTAGYGVDEEQAFPARLATLLADAGSPARLVNAGVSGDTSAGGLARLGWLLRQRPDVVVVALGANDGLRGLPLASTEDNLRAIVRQAKAAGARVLLCGMLLPPSYGPDYTDGFAAIYPRLAAEEGLALVPFLLEGVAAVPELNQADGIHPTPEGQLRVARLVLPHLGPLVDAVAAERALSPAPPPP